MSTMKTEKPESTSAPKRPESPAPQPSTPRWKSPTLGLARPGQRTEEPAEVRSGSWAESERTSGLVTGTDGVATGRTAKTENTVGVGAKRSSESETATFDGAKRTLSTHETELLAGAEASMETIRTANPRDLKLAMEGCARAGLFGEAARQDAVSRGPLSANWAGKVKTGAGAQVDVALEATASAKKLLPDLAAAIEVGVKLGWWGEASVEARAAAGPLVAEFAASIEWLVGAEATFSAKTYANLVHGVGAEFEAAVFAGVRVKGESSVTIGLKNTALELRGEVEGAVGAEATLSGEFKVGLKGVSMSVKASAWAGAKAKATGSASLKIFGKRIVTASGEVSVMVGAGVELEGAFEVTGNRIHLRGGLAAALKGGVGGLADLDIDLEALGLVIAAQLREMSAEGPSLKEKSPDFVREPLADKAAAAKHFDAGHDAVYENLLAYGNRVVMDGKGGITRQEVQGIIAESAPMLRSNFAYVETDRGIEAAARKAFGVQLTDIQVQAGMVRQLEVAKDAEAARTQKRDDENMRAARDDLRADLAGYCLKKAGEKSKNGVKEPKVAAIITAHLKTLNAVFGPETDEVVNFVAQETLAGYVKTFAWGNGKIVTWTPEPGGAEAVKAAFAKTKSDAATQVAMAKLGATLQTYRATLLADPQGKVDAAALATLVSKGVNGIAVTPALETAVVTTVEQALAGIVSNVRFKNGVLTAAADASALTATRTQKGAADAQSAQDAAVASFTAALEGYREQKTSGGKRGLKFERVRDMAVKALKALPPQTDTTALDLAMAAAAEAALGDAFGSITVVGGRVTTFTEKPGVVMADKARQKKDGVATLGGGATQDNTRRQMVADTLRSPMAAYAGKVRARQERKPGDPGAAVSKAELNAVVTKALSTIAADVRNPVGDAAVTLAVQDAFPEVTQVTVENLTITLLTAGLDGVGALAAAKRAQSTAVLKAQAAITANLRSLKDAPNMMIVQTIVNNHKGELGNLPTDELDAMIIAAVSAGLGTQLLDVDAVKGKVITLQLTQTRGRSHAVTSR